MALAVALAHLADLCTFLLVAHAFSISGEANPVAGGLYSLSPLTVVALKVIGVTLAILILARLPRRKRIIGYSLAIGVPLLGTALNTLSGLLG